MESANFKRLLKACEKLMEDPSPSATARIESYWPTLSDQFQRYKQGTLHRREKLGDLEERIGRVALRALEGVSSSASGPTRGTVTPRAVLRRRGADPSTPMSASTSASASSAAVDEAEERADERTMEEDAEEMATMAARLKEANLALQRTIKEDSKNVDKLEGAVSKNLSLLRIQTIRLGQSVSGGGSFGRALRLLALLIVFFIVYIFVYAFIRSVHKVR